MGRTRARRRARPVSPPQFGLRFTDIFLDNERYTAYASNASTGQYTLPPRRVVNSFFPSSNQGGIAR